ncbi:hypothetical protein ACFFRR_002916 [Megaselia abdita]
MTSSWSTLSEPNLSKIFSFCSYHDLKSMSLVCKNWHTQFDIYVRDKVWLCADKIVLNAKPYEFFLTKRTFEKLMITNYIIPTEPYIKDTLSPVTHIRDTKMKFTHLHIDLEDYRILPEILGSVGFTFTHLSLAVRDEKAVDASLLRECKSFRKLNCVRHLKIQGFTPEFEKLFKYFKNLKSLEWDSSQEINPYRQVMYSQMPETMEAASNNFTALRKNLVRTLLEASPNIEELSLLNTVKNFIDFNVFKELKCLKKFRTNVPGLWKNILDNKSPIESLEIGGSHIRDKNLLQITTNFRGLKRLGIGFMNYSPSPNVLKELWEMPKLNYIHFDCLNVATPDFMSFAPNITTLKINELELSVDFIAACSKATPNVEFVEMNSIQDGINFRFFQEMASNWLKLESLNIRLQTKMKFTERDLKFPLINTPIFKNLRNLLIQTDFVTVPFQFFKSFKAPNLKRASFDLDAGRPKDEKSNKILPFILANSPLIEDMNFKSCLNLNHDSVRTICKTLKNLKSLTFVECGSLRVGIVRDILKISKSIQFVNIYYFEEIGEIIDFRVKEHMANKFLRFGQTVKKVDGKNNPEKKYEMAVENLCKTRIPHLKLYNGDGLTRFLRGHNVEVVLANGVDLYKYDSALDSYSENLKRTFDDIYENVFKPQFRKCGEEDEGGSDEGEKSPRSSSKKKQSICPTKIPRVNKKDDKENQPLVGKFKEKSIKKESKVLIEQNESQVIVNRSPKKTNLLKAPQDINNSGVEIVKAESKVQVITKAVEEGPSKPARKSLQSCETKILNREPEIQNKEPTDFRVFLKVNEKSESLPKTEPILNMENSSTMEVSSKSEVEVKPEEILKSKEADEVDSVQIPQNHDQNLKVENTPLSMKVLAERKFLELPIEVKLKQLKTTVTTPPVQEPKPEQEFKVPVTPSQSKEETKKKSSAVKLRNSMVSFMSPKFKTNVLKSPIVRRFSLQKSAMDCGKALESISPEIKKMEIVTSNAVKTPLRVSFDLAQEKIEKPIAPPRKEKRKSKAAKNINDDDLEKVQVEIIKIEKRPLIIPEITITAPEENNTSAESMERRKMDDTVFEEDAKHISHYYEFSDCQETDDEFFDCEDFDNTVVYDHLCPNKRF